MTIMAMLAPLAAAALYLCDDTVIPFERKANVQSTCPRGMACNGGVCVFVSCEGANPCPAPKVCVPIVPSCQSWPCVEYKCEDPTTTPPPAPCDGVTCPAGQTCNPSTGVCEAPPSPCDGVTCAAGEMCDEATGVCTSIDNGTPCYYQSDCPATKHCRFAKEDPTDITYPRCVFTKKYCFDRVGLGERCGGQGSVQGSCRVNQCMPGLVCHSIDVNLYTGKCQAQCNVDTDCPSSQICPEQDCATGGAYKYCINKSPAGASCGTNTYPCTRRLCQDGLSCVNKVCTVPSPPTPPSPSSCNPPCAPFVPCVAGRCGDIP